MARLSDDTISKLKGLDIRDILSSLIKINGIMPRLFKWQQNLHKKRHFWLTKNDKKALLANEKALLAKKLLCKNCTNLLKELKEKRPFWAGAVLAIIILITKRSVGNV